MVQRSRKFIYQLNYQEFCQILIRTIKGAMVHLDKYVYYYSPELCLGE
jgi:hypothetical protein